MRIKNNKDNTKRVWLNQSERKQLEEYAKNDEQKLTISILNKTGIRVGSISNITYDSIKPIEDADGYIMSITNTKDTSGEYDNGKGRSIYIPQSLERNIFKFIHENDIDYNQKIINKSKRTVQRWVSNSAERMASDQKQKEYKYISPHDLRRSYITHLIHSEGLQLSIIKNQVGFEDISTLKKYLHEPTESNIASEFEQ